MTTKTHMQTITFTCDKCKTSETFDCRKGGGNPFSVISIGPIQKYDLCPECEKKTINFITTP
jgi:hypothetical protein